MITSIKKYGFFANIDPTNLFLDANTNLTEQHNQVEDMALIDQCAVPNEWIDLILLKVRSYNHDTSIFTFQLPKGSRKLNLPIGGYLLAYVSSSSDNNNSNNDYDADENTGHDKTSTITKTIINDQNLSFVIRPYTSITSPFITQIYDNLTDSIISLVKSTDNFDNNNINNNNNDNNNNNNLQNDDNIYCFNLLCKRYDQWGIKESTQTHFLFTKTDHSYRPPGIVSNYIHQLKVGQTMRFKHNASCVGRINYPFDSQIETLTLIAV
eukprot:gene10224-13755_t